MRLDARCHRWGDRTASLALARILPDALDASIFPAAMVVLLAANPFTCYWMFSGMEPIACAGLACWAVLLATRHDATRSTFLTGCLLAGIGPLVRPEMTFLGALLAVPLIGQWRRLEDRRRWHQNHRTICES